MSWGSRQTVRRATAAVGMLAMVAVSMTGCGGGSDAAQSTTKGSSGSSSQSGAPGEGGSLTVLENSGSYTWHGLDPALDPGFKAQFMYPDAIYGTLFEQGANNRPIPDLATGYKVSPDAMTATINLRHGVTFTDGTPFNSAAVRWNIERDLAPSSANACQCADEFPIASIDTPDDYTVVLHLKQPYAPIIESFYANSPNWILSPTAVKKEGAKRFAITPVGAGPFKVVSNQIGSTLKLARNPGYWQKGKPYLDSLTFKLIGSDESAYEALQAGQAQVYQNLGTISLALHAKKSLTVTPTPATNPVGVELNSTKAPFNDLRAREAIYYATDPGAINKSILLGQSTVTQSPTGPQGLFYEPTVPGYRTYNLAKAKALVQQLGGLKIRLLSSSSPLREQVLTALKAQWSRAGIDATLDSETLGVYIQLASHGNWQAQVTSLDQFDPAVGFGFDFRFASTAPFSGTRDQALDKLIAEGLATSNMSKRAAIYHQAFKLISDKAYAPMLVGTLPAYNLSARAVSGPALTTTAPEVLWEDVFLRSQGS